ncbi:hypothetical protein OUZ56_009664 [Daphnia magna]|uniref:Uncharacterized protein n=1 Tax=Daphnia magna TaxID=35525 RepID=A0ABR0AGW9_9CRUS|nr:hypothetical protein OUZ56_009664 [Daphnia magna]
MTGFLSVLHGRTRVWDCQVFHNVRWKTGAAAFLGDEQKQFKARRDHITEAIFYNNEGKEKGMATKKETEYAKKLHDSLVLSDSTTPVDSGLKNLPDVPDVSLPESSCTTSAREKLRSKMEQANRKAYALLDNVNEQTHYRFTREMNATGLFSWIETDENFYLSKISKII